MSTFATLNNINVGNHTEKKNGLTYLSWAWAWAEIKKAFPEANYTVYENEIGRPWFDDGRTGWVKTGVTIEGLEHIEYLPVMDFKNKSIPANAITSFDANKAVQRSLTKACARHGLGLYIYAGEDLPETEQADMITDKEAKILRSIMTEKQISWAEDKKYGKKIEELTKKEYVELNNMLREAKEKNEGKGNSQN